MAFSEEFFVVGFDVSPCTVTTVLALTFIHWWLEADRWEGILCIQSSTLRERNKMMKDQENMERRRKMRRTEIKKNI